MWVNPSKSLVDRALRRWATFGARADNTSAVTLLFDPPGVQRRGERSSVQQPNVETVSFVLSTLFFFYLFIFTDDINFLFSIL